MNAAAKQVARQRILIVVALLILGVYAVFSVLDTRSAQARLSEARIDLAEVVEKLDDIDRLKQAPKVAALELESPEEITNRIAKALSAAGLPASSLSEERPLDPQRIQRTDFQLRSTTIKLTPTGLPQIIKFCDALHDEDSGAVVRDITLTDPQNGAISGTQEKWEAQLTLTQMIFSPTSR